jgi:hypothetical protein
MNGMGILVYNYFNFCLIITQVSVRIDGKHVNVGAIISKEYVLTEAYHYEK